MTSPFRDLINADSFTNDNYVSLKMEGKPRIWAYADKYSLIYQLHKSYKQALKK